MLSFLSFRDVVAVGAVCRQLRDVASSPVLWRAMLRRDLIHTCAVPSERDGPSGSPQRQGRGAGVAGLGPASADAGFLAASAAMLGALGDSYGQAWPQLVARPPRTHGSPLAALPRSLENPDAAGTAALRQRPQPLGDTAGAPGRSTRFQSRTGRGDVADACTAAIGSHRRARAEHWRARYWAAMQQLDAHRAVTRLRSRVTREQSHANQKCVAPSHSPLGHLVHVL